MPLENAQYISELNPAWPLGSDGVNTSDDQHRNTKRATQQSLPNISGAVTANQDDLNLLSGAAANGSGLNPVGTVIAGAWATAPNGYLACDGVTINPIYTALIALVGTETPDLRGTFIRGTSADSSVDPDGPRVALTTQLDTVGPHLHPVQGHEQGGSDSSNIVASSGPPTVEASTLNSTGVETRPKNTALMYVIKW